MKSQNRNIICLGILGILTTGPVLASGFDNMGIGSLDLLYDPAKYALEFSAVYVNRNVDYQSSEAGYSTTVYVPGVPPIDGGSTTVEDGATKARATPDVWNYAVNGKFSITDNFSCLARLNNPGTILEEVPEGWNGRFSIIKTELTTFGIDATCAIRAQISPGHYVRVIGGARYVEADIDVLKMTELLGSVGMAAVNISGSGIGWRAGVAYEFPEYAIRASFVYDHEIELDLTGNLNSSSFNAIPMQSTIAMPKGFEFNLQSGIAPRWLAMLGVKWVNWSSLDKLVVTDSLEGILTTNRFFNFSDGWSIKGGIGHQFTDNIQVGANVTWDQGIGGSYSDTWQLGLGGAYKINDNVTFSLGGAVIYKTAHTETLQSVTTIAVPGTTMEIKDTFKLTYDSSVNFAIGSKLKLSF